MKFLNNEKFSYRLSHFLFIFLLIFSLSIHANTQKNPPIKNIVFFGDSLTDNGNLYHMLLHIIPKSPPYFAGRFSNGSVWSDQLAEDFLKNYSVHSTVYAVGGATIIPHLPSFKFVSPDLLNLQISRYLEQNMFTTKENTLFFIWMGGNDYLFDDYDNPDKLTTQIIKTLQQQITRLIEAHANYIVLINLPDMGNIPFAKINNKEDRLHVLSIMHNSKIQAMTFELQMLYPAAKIILIDIYAIMRNVKSHLDFYNQKFHTHIQDVTNACFTGGFFRNNISIEKEQLTENFLKTDSLLSMPVTQQWIRYSPVLRETYFLTNRYKLGVVPCNKPDEYIFWDAIHPSRVGHQMTATFIEEIIEKDTTLHAALANK